MFQMARREFVQGTVALAIGTALPVAYGNPASSATPKRKIRIGQIGVGHAHASKLEVYRKSPDYEVVGIVEPDEILRQRASEQAPFRDLRWMTREELLNTPDLDGVLVETRVADLLENAEVCLEAGKHIHLDKPAGASYPHFQKLVKIAEGRRLMIQLGYMYRYNPALLLLESFLKQGWMGDIFEVHAVMSKVVPAAQRISFAEFPGGMMFELGCHLLDSIVWLFGVPEKITPYPRHTLETAKDRLNDNMLAVLEYPRCTITVRSSALEVDGFSRRHLAVCGTGGTMHIQPLDDPGALVTFAEPHENYKAGPQPIRFPKFTRYLADAAEMACVIRGEREPRFSLSHELAVQRVVLAASNMTLDL